MNQSSNPAPQGGENKAAPVQTDLQQTAPASEQQGLAGNAAGESKPETEAAAATKSEDNSAAKPEAKPETKPETKPESEVPVASKEKSPEAEALELAQREKKEEVEARKQALAQREKEAKDRRSQLLKAVQVSAPEINKSLVKTFERLSLEKHEFAQKELVRMFKNDAQIKDSVDFFDLKLAQREDLLDRIGFYKGIVIDHSLSNPVETGFREVLKRVDNGVDDGDADQSTVATVLYRKPNFSGYYENYYTSSESLHQIQKNGVTDIKSSLNVVGGRAVSVGVGASGAYYDAESSNDGVMKKKLYITANFFLPKVELSFDDSVPCASSEFEAACEEALSADTDEGRFSALVAVLAKFGQFVPTQTLVGGRLFATDVKEFTGNESESEMATRYAARIKVGVESVTASFESDTSVEQSKQTNTRGNEQGENQQYTIHAVGGEGAVVEQAGRWAESLSQYQRWSAVQREKLVPSIDLLSKTLRLRAWDSLKAFAAKNSAMYLIEEYKAYFLFYGDYDLKAGRLTRSDIVIFRNNNSQHCLAVLGESPQNGGLIGKPFDWAQQFLWRVTPNGNIVSAIPVSTGFPGHKKTVEFALTVLGKAPEGDTPQQETFQVVLRELGTEKNQAWDFTARGELRNTAFGTKYALSMPLDDRPVLKSVQNGNDTTTYWSAQEAMPADIEKIESRKVYGKLSHPSGLVLSIDGYEDDANSFVLSDQRRVLLQPDNGGKHQLWHLRPDGVIVSALSISSNNSLTAGDVYLSQTPDQSIVAQAQNITAQTFRTGDKGLVYTVNEANQTLYVGAAVADNTSGQRVAPITNEHIALSFQAMPAEARPIPYSIGLSTEITGSCERLKTVDKRELKVDGYLTGIEFILEKRGKDSFIAMNEYFRMRMRLSVTRKTGSVQVELADEPDKDDVDRDFLCDEDGRSDVRVDDRFLLLPEEPIYSFRLRIHEKPVKRLAFEYRKSENGPWIGLSDTNAEAKTLNVNDIKVSSALDAETRTGTKVLGVALAYDPSAQLLRPKLLRRLI